MGLKVLKKLLALIFLFQFFSVLATRKSISRNRHQEFYHHNASTNPALIKAEQKRKNKKDRQYLQMRTKSNTCRECGTALAIMGGFVAYSAFLTWIAMNNSVRQKI